MIEGCILSWLFRGNSYFSSEHSDLICVKSEQCWVKTKQKKNLDNCGSSKSVQYYCLICVPWEKHAIPIFPFTVNEYFEQNIYRDVSLNDGSDGNTAIGEYFSPFYSKLATSQSGVSLNISRLVSSV